MTRRQTPEQLSLPGTSTEVTALKAYVTDLCDENRALKDELHAVRLAARQALDEAYRRIEQWEWCYDTLRGASSTQSSATLPPDALAQRTWMHRELTKLLAIAHPDKWSGSSVAEEVTKHIIDMRQRLQEGGV
jgi:hypothetical protein